MSSIPPDDPASLRSYRLIAEIGRGGMANVYLAVARGPAGFNKLVVVKKTRKDLVTEGDSLAMFLDEARLAARMNHPNVVQTYEIGQEGDRYFIAMEYLDGQPYSRVRSRMRGQLPLGMHLRVIADMLTGLHHAHELRDFDGTPLNVVHRDATPQNVFITYDGSIKVVDFGIAKAMDASAQTRTGVVKGKVAYMAPEQVRGEKLDRRTDIFAAGVMLFEAVADRKMWEEMPDVSVVHELMYDRVPQIAQVAPATPPMLVHVVQRALAPRREDRYQTAVEMARDLEGYLAHTGQRASARDVGELIAPAFEADRQRVRAVIESQLRDVRWTGVMPKATRSDLPNIEMVPSSGQSPSGAVQAGSGDVRASQRFNVGTDPGFAALHPVTGSSSVVLPELPNTNPSARVPVAVAPPGPLSFAPTAGGAAVPVAAHPAHPAHRSFLIPALVAGVVSIAVVALGIKVLVNTEHGAVNAAAAASASAAAVNTAAPSAEPRDVAPDAVKLTIRPKPAEARIYLDGVLLATGPFEGKVLRSDKPRKVRVEAENYLPKEMEITLTADAMLTFDLEKDDKAKPASSPSPGGRGPAGGSLASPGSPGGRGPKPRHDIDSDSPYKR